MNENHKLLGEDEILEICRNLTRENVRELITALQKQEDNEIEKKLCEQCENYALAIRETRRKRIFKLAYVTGILVFVAVLSVASESYFPCIFLVLLLLAKL